jgi:amino acid adenylation domain-containing protein
MSEPSRPLPGPPSLVADPPAPGAHCVIRRRARLSGELWQRLRAHASEAGVPASPALACAFADTASAWSREPLIALLVGSGQAPVRVEVDADPERPFVDRARTLCGRLSQSAEGGAAGGPREVLWARLLLDGASGRWLDFEAVEAEDCRELVLTWDCPESTLPARMLDNLAGSHTELLEALAGDRAAWDRSAADHLPAPQRRRREEVNSTSQPLPSRLLHELFWQQANRCPDRTAVVASGRALTYRELRAGASALADRLTALGVHPGRLVAVVMDKGWEQVVAVLGVLQAGGAYVPVAPDLPRERFQHLLRHAEVEVAVVAGQTVALPWPSGVRPVTVEEGMLAGDGSLAPNRAPGFRDLAYVIYTSGSTGVPKGVMIDHRGAVNTILDVNMRFGVSDADRVLALSSLSFDLSVYDIFGLLAAGGTIVIPPPGTNRAPWSWQELVDEHGVTVWNTVPALMEMLVTHAAGRGDRLSPSLRLVLMSGDWIPVSLPGRIRDLAAAGIEIIGMGGATEASIWSNAYRIGEVDPAWPSIPYGKPLGNQRFEVLDGSLRRRPDLVPGELYIAGDGLAMGYWRDEERTRRSFIHHPRTGERLYRTGDLGRYLPDGNLEFLGREDFQVKIQGFRVELGEIEAALLGHDGVASAVVAAVGPLQGERRLVAYVTRAAGGAAQERPQELARVVRDHLGARLPSYMVPSQVVVMDALPLTANGKVDRGALPGGVTGNG